MACVFSWTLFACQNSNIWLKIDLFFLLALFGLFKSSLQNSKLCIYKHYKLQIYINNTAGLKPKRPHRFRIPGPTTTSVPKICVGQIPPRCVASHGAFALEVPLPLRRFAQSCCDLWRCSRASGEGHATLLGKPTNRKFGWKSWRSWVCEVDDLFFWVWLFFFLMLVIIGSSDFCLLC